MQEEVIFPLVRSQVCKSHEGVGGEEQAACSPSHFQKEENQFGYCSSD